MGTQQRAIDAAGGEWNDAGNPMLHYYDGDFPSGEHARFPENFDEVTEYQGLRHDVARYRELALAAGGPVLEACCGTGRVAIPLARAGLDVTGVDVSDVLLAQLEANVARAAPAARPRLSIVRQDVIALALARRDHALAIVAFNSLCCLPDRDAQLAALAGLARHLAPDGTLVLDLVNPLRLPVDGDPVPKPFFTRRNPHTGRRYTRFAMLGPFDAEHRQTLHGWYDEPDEDGRLLRRPYATTWRPIHRFEIEWMLREVGLRLTSLEGGHQGEAYTARSPRMFLQARRPAV